MSPSVAIAPTISPPAPRPCSARNAISSRHGLRQAGQRRPDEEDHDRDDEELLPPVHVAELAVERRGDRGREDVSGHHPGQVRHPAEVAHDPRQRGAHDEVVEHGEQDRQQQPGQHDHHLARREELPASPPALPPTRLAGLCHLAVQPTRSPHRPGPAGRRSVFHSLRRTRPWLALLCPPGPRPGSRFPLRSRLVTYRPASHYARAVTNRPSSKIWRPQAPQGSAKQTCTTRGLRRGPIPGPGCRRWRSSSSPSTGTRRPPCARSPSAWA